MTINRLGIISAMAEEQQGLVAALTDPQEIVVGGRTFFLGRLGTQDCVLVLSRMGKVAAAATAVCLLERFNVSHLLFTGVAGAADPALRIGDVVIARQLVQHDMDCSPLFPRFEIPLTGQSFFDVDADMTERLTSAVQKFLKEDFSVVLKKQERQHFDLTMPQLHCGLIASGDEFITNPHKLDALRRDLPGLMAVEMEGAAVAQVCFEFDIPFSIVRTISDSSNESSPSDFKRFVETVASRYAFHIVTRFCSL